MHTTTPTPLQCTRRIREPGVMRELWAWVLLALSNSTISGTITSKTFKFRPCLLAFLLACLIEVNSWRRARMISSEHSVNHTYICAYRAGQQSPEENWMIVHWSELWFHPPSQYIALVMVCCWWWCFSLAYIVLQTSPSSVTNFKLYLSILIPFHRIAFLFLHLLWKSLISFSIFFFCRTFWTFLFDPSKHWRSK